MKRPSRVESYNASGLTNTQLRARRRALRLSRCELARALDISLGTLTRWEQGHLPAHHRGILELALRELEHSLNRLVDSSPTPDNLARQSAQPSPLDLFLSTEQIHCDLTEREFEVALLVGRGLSNREIAACLTISVRTAEGHVERIRGKLGLRSRAALAGWIAGHIAHQVKLH